MANSFVGLENLPNVYFRDITISSLNDVENQERFVRITVKLIVKDTKIDGKFQWANDNLLSTYLNVTLLQSLDKSFTDQVTGGQYTLYDFDYKSSLDYDAEKVTSLTKRLRPQKDPEMLFVGDNMYEFQYEFSFDLREQDLINVCYFAALTINQTMLGVDYKADFDNNAIRSLQGPISSEKVFVDGAFQNKTNIFYLPDNTVYAGPVHSHQGGFMAGAFHTSDNHPSLRKVEVQNLKLKDNRIKNFQPKQIYNYGNRSLIGTPYDTRDENYNIKRLLSFNIEGIFLEKTKYGSLIKTIDESLYNQAISNFKIHKLNIKRKFVRKVIKSNSFKQKKESFEIVNDKIQNAISFSDSGADNILSSDECELSEIRSYNNKYRYFSFVDKKIKMIRYGHYIHSVELIFIDRTKELLLSVLQNYRNDISELEKYLLRSNKQSNLDANNQFLKSFYDSEFSIYGLNNPENADTTIWLRSPENYSILKTYLFNLTDTDRINLFQESYASINPKTGNPSNILEFIQAYKDAIKIFKDKFKIDKLKVGGNLRIIPRKSFGENPSIYIQIDKNYENIFSQSTLEPGYSILEPEEDAPLSINIYSRSTFAQRVSDEKNRFFRANPSLDFEESANLNNEEISSLVDIDSYSTSYLSPNKFIYGGKKIDLTETNIVNTKFLNDTISKIIKRPNRRRIFTNNPTISRLRRNPAQPVTSDRVRSFEDASEYIGDNSEFLNLSNEFATEDLELVERILVKEKFLTSLIKKQTTKLIKNFDLKKENNVIFKKKRNTMKRGKSKSLANQKKRDLMERKRSKKLSTELRRVPNHLKAVITSRSSTVKTSLLSSVDDLLAGDRYNNTLLIQHFAVQQIEYLDGYVLDKNGNEIFNFPNWKQLDADTFNNNPDKIFICRAYQYVDELLEISIPDELSFELFDKYFVIIPDGEAVSNEESQQSLAFQTALDLSEQGSINYDYSTSNPITQPIKEKSIFTESARPSTPQETVQTSNRGSDLSSRQRRGPQTTSRPTSTPRGGY